MGRLQRRIGPVSLLFGSLGGAIGSGWLFAAPYAGQIAGPAAIVSWGIDGLIALLLARVGQPLPLLRRFIEGGGGTPTAQGLDLERPGPPKKRVSVGHDAIECG